MIRTVIIAQERRVREKLKRVIRASFSHLIVVGEATSTIDGEALIEEAKPELLILDLDFTKKGGFELLDQVKHPRLEVLLLTAFESNALRAIRYDVLDFILKPIKDSELRNALRKVKSQPAQNYLTRQELTNFFESFSRERESKKLVVRNSNLISFVKVSEIVRCEADGHYTSIHLKNGERIVASQALKEYDNLLPESEFVRVHKSHLINLRFVKQFSNVDGGYIIMEDKAKIAIARRRKNEFFHRLQEVHA